MTSQIEVKKIYGFELQSNSFQTREGSLEVATNVVLTQDNIITKKRGQSVFFDGGSVEIRNQGEYRTKGLGFCEDRVQVYYQNPDGSFLSVSNLTGESFTIAAGTKARTVETNANLYFTTDQRVMKLESLTGNVLRSGIPSATDIQIIAQDQSPVETFFRPDGQIAYRIVFGRKDANSNFVIGAPSQIATATNPVYNSASITLTSPTVKVTTSIPHGFSASDSVYITQANGSGVPDGVYTVTSAPTSTEFWFDANSPTSVTTLKWGAYVTPTLEAAVPSDLSTEYLYQIYRSQVSQTMDVPPDESTLQLIEELNLTAGQISTGFIIYRDEIPDILRSTYLYTNPNTGEPRGIAEANEAPPKATDMALFKNHVFYGGIVYPFTLPLSLITSTTAGMPDGSELTFTEGMSVRTYIGMANPKVGNRTVRAETVGFVLTTVTVTYTDHGFNNGDIIAVAEALDSNDDQLATLPQGEYVVSNATANTFDITAPSTPTGLVTLSFQGIETASGKRIFYIEHASVSSVAASIDATARGLVRAVNRDEDSPASGYYVSSVSDIPGKMVFRSKSLINPFYINSVTSAINDSFSPILSTTGQAVIATREDTAGVLAFAKPGEPEAVPLVNQIPCGSRSARILRIIALRDSLIVMKEDGAYRINGSDYSTFTATILDSTVLLKAVDSVAVLNNQVFCVSDQGVTTLSETSAAIVSRQIEPLLTAVVGKTYFDMETHAVSYESERLYLLTTVSPNSTSPDVVYCYNDKTSGWSTWTYTFLDAIIRRSDDKLYYVSFENEIYQERKNQNRLDFCADSFDATVLSTPTDTTATLSIVGGVAAVGDIFVFGDVINRIVEITSVNNILVYRFSRPYSFETGNVGVLYKAIFSQVRFSPITGPGVSRMKQYSEFQAAFRNNTSVSNMEVYFLTDTIAGTEITEWNTIQQGEGWGNEPWGQFPWGQEEGIDQIYTTTATQQLRTYIPLEAQRATFIQADLQHAQAGENIMLQTVAFTARQYGHRTTR